MKFLCGLCFAMCAFAQPFSFGLKIGAPVTDAFNVATGGSAFNASTKRFTVGPTVELKLPFGFGIEVDALYKRLEYSYVSGLSLASGDLTSANRTANSWEFPILAKYRLPIPIVKPYGVGGLSFNRLSGLTQTLSCVGGGCSHAFSDVAHNSNVGVVFGAGLQINVLLLKISPEIRFTRWGFANFGVTGASGSALKSNQNQADLLIGFTF